MPGDIMSGRTATDKLLLHTMNQTDDFGRCMKLAEAKLPSAGLVAALLPAAALGEIARRQGRREDYIAGQDQLYINLDSMQNDLEMAQRHRDLANGNVAWRENRISLPLPGQPAWPPGAAGWPPDR